MADDEKIYVVEDLRIPFGGEKHVWSPFFFTANYDAAKVRAWESAAFSGSSTIAVRVKDANSDTDKGTTVWLKRDEGER